MPLPTLSSDALEFPTLHRTRHRDAHSAGTRLIKLFFTYDYLSATKAVMEMILPNVALTPEQTTKLRGQLEEMGFFEWIQ